MWTNGEGAPDFVPSQYAHSAEIHNSYMDPYTTFNNLYQQEDIENGQDEDEEEQEW